MKRTLVLALAAALAAPVAFAQSGGNVSTSTVTAPGKRVDTNTVSLAGTVTAVDKAKRTVTVKGAEGKTLTLPAGPEVKNFDQIKVGDSLLVKYVEALSIELKKGGTAPVAVTGGAVGAAAKPGEKPAAMAGRQVKVVSNVTALDAAKQTVTLKGPEGTADVKVNNPDQFKLVKVGDQVEITYTEAFAVALEAAPAKAPAKEAPKTKEAPKK